MWQERARVLGERLALMAPESSTASNLAPEPPDPTPGPSQPFPWPLPLHPNVRALAPWVLLAAILLAVGVVGWLR
jgi:hypothetical protein